MTPALNLFLCFQKTKVMIAALLPSLAAGKKAFIAGVADDQVNFTQFASQIAGFAHIS